MPPNTGDEHQRNFGGRGRVAGRYPQIAGCFADMSVLDGKEARNGAGRWTEAAKAPRISRLANAALPTTSEGWVESRGAH